jgi:hypothetical protein
MEREKAKANQSSEHFRHGKNCSALSVTICLLHRIASSHPWVNILLFYIEIGINPTFFFMYACYYLIFMFKLINCLLNYRVVLLLCVVSLMAGSITGVPVFLVWWIPSRNASALLPNLRNDQFVHRSLQVLHY